MELIPNKAIKPQLNYVSDGDTISITYQGFSFNTRIRWIDCPETKKSNQNSDDPLILLHWNYAQIATEFLTDLLTNQQIIVIPIKLDYYGRWLCDCYINSVKSSNNIQLKLINAGLATYFIDDFAKYDFNRRELSLYLGIIKNCVNAYNSKVGFWTESNFILPAEFKKLTW